MSHILLNNAFLLFLNILDEIQRELFFLDIKITLSEMNTEILIKFVFLPGLKEAIPEENLDLFKQFFLIKPVKGDKYLKKNFFSRK